MTSFSCEATNKGWWYIVLGSSPRTRWRDGGAGVFIVPYATRWHDYRQIWLMYIETLSVNLSHRQTQSCPQQGNKTHWQTAAGSRFNSDWGWERRKHWGQEGGREGGRAETELGGKLKCQTIKWRLSTPASQWRCWVNSSPAPKWSTAVIPFVRLCVRAHTCGRSQSCRCKHALSCYRKSHCCCRDQAEDTLRACSRKHVCVVSGRRAHGTDGSTS